MVYFNTAIYGPLNVIMLIPRQKDTVILWQIRYIDFRARFNVIDRYISVVNTIGLHFVRNQYWYFLAYIHIASIVKQH